MSIRQSINLFIYISHSLGCHIRIGKEDTTVKWPHKDDYIVSCKEEVEKHVTIARLLGREPMTAVEFRKVLGLPAFTGSF